MPFFFFSRFLLNFQVRMEERGVWGWGAVRWQICADIARLINTNKQQRFGLLCPTKPLTGHSNHFTNWDNGYFETAFSEQSPVFVDISCFDLLQAGWMLEEPKAADWGDKIKEVKVINNHFKSSCLFSADCENVSLNKPIKMLFYIVREVKLLGWSRFSFFFVKTGLVGF